MGECRRQSLPRRQVVALSGILPSTIREASNLLESLEQSLASGSAYASQDVRGRVTMFPRGGNQAQKTHLTCRPTKL
jgi:hypothetical protein